MKHNFKRVCAFLLAVVMCIGAVLPVFASESGETVKCPGATETHTLENSDATKHTVYNPGCQTLGYTVYKCNACGTYFADSWMPALDGCVFDETKSEVITPDYCDTEGKTKKWCNTHECETVVTVNVNTGKDGTGEHVWGDWQIDGKACTEEGATRTRTCTLCGKTETEANPDSAAGHDWELDHFEFADGEITLPYCGEMYWVLKEKVDAEGKPVLNADGTPVMELVETKKDIVAVYICSVCGAEHETDNVILDDLKHDFDTDVEGKYFRGYKEEPTCSEDGIGIFECKNCYYQKEFVVAATGIHDFTYEVEAKDVTCTEDGFKAGLKCQNCDAAPAEGGYELIEKLGHKVTEGTVVYATCTENGSYVCSNCNEKIGGSDITAEGYDKSEVEFLEKKYCGIDGLVATGHTWSPEKPTHVIEATCETFGFTIFACTTCGADAHIDTVPKINHKNKVTVTAANKAELETKYSVTIDKVSTSADCEKDGLIVEFCPDCKKVFETKVDAKNHKWEKETVEATCFESEYTIEVCANCQAEQNKTYVKPNVAENWDPDNHYDWIYKNYTTWPTCTENGLAIFYCPKCSAWEEDVVEAFGHDFYKKTPVLDDAGHIKVDNNGQPVYEYVKDSKGNKVLNVVDTIDATCDTPEYDVCACTNVNKELKPCGFENDKDYVKAGTELNHKKDGKDAYVYVETIAPTCADGGKYGYDLYVCTLCKDEIERNKVAYDKNDKLHHQNAQLDTSDPNYPTGVIRPGSCDIIGLEAYYCDKCDYDFYYVVPNTGKGHSPVPEKNNATCDAAGSYICEYCKESVAIPATGHTFGEWVKEVPATCDKNGVKGYYQCTKCYLRYDEDKETYLGKNDTDLKIPATGHDWSVWSPATCNPQAGYRICKVCGAVPGRTELNLRNGFISPEYDANGNGKIDILQPGEEWHEGIDYQAPLVHDFVKDPNWIKIDEQYTTPSGEIGHGYEIPVGCENDGYWHYYCQNGCGQEWIDSFKKMTGHTEVEIPAVEATCTSDGWTAGVKCAVCDKVLVAPEKVTANHENKAGDILVPGECEVVDGICTPEEGEDRHCVHCDKDIIHNYVVTVVEETCVTYQYTLYVCTVPGCTHQYMEEDPTEGLGDHIAADEPVYDFTKACDAEGSMSIVCKNCKTVLETGVRGHKFTNYVVVTPADIAEAGSETAKCDWATECKCEATDTREIPALDGIKFHYSFDNAVKSGYAFVNTGRIYLTINYTAQNASVNDILLALSYDSDVLTYVNAQLKCTGFDLANCEVGGVDADGKVSIRARANAETAENANVTLPATGEFAVIEFAIKADVFAANASQLVTLPTIDIDVLENVDAGSVVVDKDHNDIAHNFGEIKVQKIEKLGDVNNDSVVDDRDAVLLFEYIFSGEYSAEADINQNGAIDLNDFQLLKQYTISSISYADMCAGKVA